eukprot:5731946-Prymnesium_polylepis.1
MDTESACGRCARTTCACHMCVVERRPRCGTRPLGLGALRLRAPWSVRGVRSAVGASRAWHVLASWCGCCSFIHNVDFACVGGQ